jgi:hypothetical protein
MSVLSSSSLGSRSRADSLSVSEVDRRASYVSDLSHAKRCAKHSLVEISPVGGVRRYALSWAGMTIEIVHFLDPTTVELRFQASVQ